MRKDAHPPFVLNSIPRIDVLSKISPVPPTYPHPLQPRKEEDTSIQSKRRGCVPLAAELATWSRIFPLEIHSLEQFKSV